MRHAVTTKARASRFAQIISYAGVRTGAKSQQELPRAPPMASRSSPRRASDLRVRTARYCRIIACSAVTPSPQRLGLSAGEPLLTNDCCSTVPVSPTVSSNVASIACVPVSPTVFRTSQRIGSFCCLEDTSSRMLACGRLSLTIVSRYLDFAP